MERKYQLLSLLSRHYNAAAILLIIALCLVIYQKVGKINFIMDDIPSIYANSFVHKGIDGIPDLLTTTLWRGDTTKVAAVKAYRPLTMISFAINYELFGLDPAPFHWTQLAIYIVLCIFSYLTLQELIGQERKHIALLAAVIFAVHPVHTEVVCNLKSRDELLSLFFAVLALYNVARHINTGNSKYKYFAAFLYALGLFSKETAVVFLGIIPLTYYFFSSLRIAEIIKNTIPFLIGFAVFMIARHAVLSSETLPWVEITVNQNPLLLIKTWSQKWGTILYINGKYLQLMAFPYQLTFSYFLGDIPFIDIWHWKALLTLIAYGLIGFYIYKNFKSKDIGAYGLLCYLAGLSIFSHTIPIIPFSNAMGERLAFTMSWGWCLFAGYTIYTISSKLFSKDYPVSFKVLRIGLSTLSIVILLFFVYKSRTRVSAWENDLVLCMTDEKVSPKSIFINYALHFHYYKQGLDLGDITLLNKSEKYINNLIYELDPLNPLFWIRKGHLLLLRGERKEALNFFDKGIYLTTGGKIVYFNQELEEQNWDNLKNKVSVFDYPSPGYAYEHVGTIFFSVKDYATAIVCFERGLPHMKSQLGKFYMYRNIGICHLMLNQYEKAVNFFLEADKVLPGSPYVYEGLRKAYSALKDTEKANYYQDKIRLLGY